MTPPQSDARAALLDSLNELFRRKGYDGVSIGDISAETGLGRSSLYHHFPGGKAEMAEAVLAYTRAAMEDHFFSPLTSAKSLRTRIKEMMAAVDGVYRSGEGPCVLASLLSSSDEGPLTQGLAKLFEDWVAAIASSLVREGVAPKDARRRALTALALIQGGLVLARGLKDKSAFASSLEAAEATLLAPHA